MLSNFVDLVYIPDFSSEELIILNARLQFEKSFCC